MLSSRIVLYLIMSLSFISYAISLLPWSWSTFDMVEVCMVWHLVLPCGVAVGSLILDCNARTVAMGFLVDLCTIWTLGLSMD